MKEIEIESIGIIIVSGAAIGLYWLIDPNKDMERHLHKHAKYKYYILLVVVATLSLAFTFHLRHVAAALLKFIYKAGKRYLIK